MLKLIKKLHGPITTQERGFMLQKVHDMCDFQCNVALCIIFCVSFCLNEKVKVVGMFIYFVIVGTENGNSTRAILMV